MTQHRITHLAQVGALVAALAVLTAACSSGTTGPTGSSSGPPSSPGYISVAPTVQKDSIEDVNSTKDMTGVVTTYSGDNNPYFHLIPYVCPFIPDAVVKSLGANKKMTGFEGQHKLLQTCILQTESTPEGGAATYTAQIQAVSLGVTLAPSDNRFIRRNVDLGEAVRGITFKNDTSDLPGDQSCNVAFGTFYGSAITTVSSFENYLKDPCADAERAARLLRKHLPQRPNQMRPTE